MPQAVVWVFAVLSLSALAPAAWAQEDPWVQQQYSEDPRVKAIGAAHQLHLYRFRSEKARFESDLSIDLGFIHAVLKQPSFDVTELEKDHQRNKTAQEFGNSYSRRDLDLVEGQFSRAEQTIQDRRKVIAALAGDQKLKVTLQGYPTSFFIDGCKAIKDPSVLTGATKLGALYDRDITQLTGTRAELKQIFDQYVIANRAELERPINRSDAHQLETHKKKLMFYDALNHANQAITRLQAMKELRLKEYGKADPKIAAEWSKDKVRCDRDVADLKTSLLVSPAKTSPAVESAPNSGEAQPARLAGSSEQR